MFKITVNGLGSNANFSDCYIMKAASMKSCLSKVENSYPLIGFWQRVYFVNAVEGMHRYKNEKLLLQVDIQEF